MVRDFKFIQFRVDKEGGWDDIFTMLDHWDECQGGERHDAGVEALREALALSARLLARDSVVVVSEFSLLDPPAAETCGGPYATESEIPFEKKDWKNRNASWGQERICLDPLGAQGLATVGKHYEECQPDLYTKPMRRRVEYAIEKLGW